MSHPSLPSYMGSWEELINMLMNNPFLGSGGGGVFPSTHSDAMLMSSRGRAIPGLALNPIPVPWRSAVSALVAAVSLRQVAAEMPDGPAKIELNQRVDQAIAEIIDDWCGTPPRVVPWPWPGPPPWNLPIASELAAVATTLHADAARTELLEVAGQIAAKSFGPVALGGGKLPTLEEIDAELAAAFPPGDSGQCDIYRDELTADLEELQHATGRRRRQLLINIRAIRDEMKALHCLAVPH